MSYTLSLINSLKAEVAIIKNPVKVRNSLQCQTSFLKNDFVDFISSLICEIYRKPFTDRLKQKLRIISCVKLFQFTHLSIKTAIISIFENMITTIKATSQTWT